MRSRRAMRASVSSRDRRVMQVRRRLDDFDLGRRLGTIGRAWRRRTAGWARPIVRRQHRADAQLRECAGRLDTLSPLAVLGRGYAVVLERGQNARCACGGRLPGETIQVTLATGRDWPVK